MFKKEKKTCGDIPTHFGTLWKMRPGNTLIKYYKRKLVTVSILTCALFNLQRSENGIEFE